MRINTDFEKPVVLATQDLPWVPSPLPGVERRLLDRVGDEVARATSLVRYAPDSYFDPHTHGGGEEFLVVSGTFSDEHGDYEAGTYVRNPVGSSHKPYSKDGCVIFVKLWQMVPEDQEFVRIKTDTANWQDAPGGVSSLPLTERPEETVCMIDLAPGATYAIGPEAGGAEVLTLSGSLTLDGAPMPEAAWARLPKGLPADLTSPTGARFYLKTGHLAGTIEAPG